MATLNFDALNGSELDKAASDFALGAQSAIRDARLCANDTAGVVKATLAVALSNLALAAMEYRRTADRFQR